MPSVTAIATRPMIELSMEADEKGEVAPVIPATWSFSDELVNKLSKKNYTNPYVIIAVGYEELTGWNNDDPKFRVTKVYVRSLLDASPKEFIQFSKPGTNIVMAFVVNVDGSQDERQLWKYKRHPEAMKFDHVPKRKSFEIEIWDDSAMTKRFNVASFRHDVIVPAEMFAAEPSKPAKALVRQYYPYNDEFDQCHFRKRFLISLALTVPVQIWGVVARVFTLLYAVVFAKRGIQLRLLFALNPHDFGHALWSSFWYEKKDRSKRTSLLKWLSPPQLILYVLIAAGILLPGLVGALLSHLHTVGKATTLSSFGFGDVLLWTAIIDPTLVVIVAFCFFFFAENGKRIRRNWLRKRALAKAESVIPTDPSTMFDLLHKRAQDSADLTPDKVRNKTLRLKVLDLKMKVCKPFALKV